MEELVNDGLGAFKGLRPEGDKKIYSPFFCSRWKRITRLVREHTICLRMPKGDALWNSMPRY